MIFLPIAHSMDRLYQWIRKLSTYPTTADAKEYDKMEIRAWQYIQLMTSAAEPTYS